MRRPETTCFELLTIRTDQFSDKSREIGLAPSIPFHLARLRTTSGTGLTSNLDGLHSNAYRRRCRSSSLSTLPPPSMTYLRQKNRPNRWKTRRRKIRLPSFGALLHDHLEAHATIVDERGWNIRAKKMGAFRFCNEIGYRRYNSRSVNPSIIVSAAITLPRLTII